MNDTTILVEGDRVKIRVPSKFDFFTRSILFFNPILILGGVYEGVYLGDRSFGRSEKVWIDNTDVVTVPRSWIEKTFDEE